jgi:hypothetical protein
MLSTNNDGCRIDRYPSCCHADATTNWIISGDRHRTAPTIIETEI